MDHKQVVYRLTIYKCSICNRLIIYHRGAEQAWDHYHNHKDSKDTTYDKVYEDLD